MQLFALPPTTSVQNEPSQVLADRGFYRLYHDAKSLNAGFTKMLQELIAICRTEYFDEDQNKIEPANLAMSSLIEVLVDCNFELVASDQRAIPEGTVSMDEDGGFRVEWHFGTKAVFVEISGTSSNESYIYFQNGDRNGIVRQVTGSRLAEHLRVIMR